MINVAQAFAISLLSNRASSKKGSAIALAAAMKTSVQTILTDPNFVGAVGTWDLVWGPYVYQVATSDAADNTIMLVYSASENTYVLAIAATNPTSKVDWLSEDAAATSLVLLPNGDGQSHISWGTNIGLAFLSGLGGANNTILDVLASDLPNKSTANFVITGHSLAGALSPALGTSLFNPVNGPLASAGWNPDKLFMLPTAGPSVGDQSYYDLVGKTFTSTAVLGFNQLHFNTIDVVPQAWDSKLFNGFNLLNLYQPNLEASTTITNVIAEALTVPPSPNPYVQLPAISFTGEFQTVSGLIPPFEDDTARFVAQMIYQHIYAYAVELAPALPTLRTTNGELVFSLINPFTQIDARGDVTAIADYLIATYGK